MTPALAKRLAEIGGRLEKCRVDEPVLGVFRCSIDLAYLKRVVEKQAQVIAAYDAVRDFDPETKYAVRAALAELKKAEEADG